MTQPLNNAAWIEDMGEGLFLATVQVWTKISNIKRQALITGMGLMQIESLEELAREMDYTEVDRLTKELEPQVHGANGR